MDQASSAQSKQMGLVQENGPNLDISCAGTAPFQDTTQGMTFVKNPFIYMQVGTLAAIAKLGNSLETKLQLCR